MNATATMTTQMAKTIDAAVMKLSRKDDPDAIKAATEFSKQLLAELGLPAINEAAPKTAEKTKTKPAEKPVEKPVEKPEAAADSDSDGGSAAESAATSSKPAAARKRTVSKKMKEDFAAAGGNEAQLKEAMKAYKDASDDEAAVGWPTFSVRFRNGEAAEAAPATPPKKAAAKAPGAPKKEKAAKAPKPARENFIWTPAAKKLFAEAVEAAGGKVTDLLKSEFAEYANGMPADDFKALATVGHMRAFLTARDEMPPLEKCQPAAVETADQAVAASAAEDDDEDMESFEFEGEELFIGVTSGKVYRQSESAGDVLIGVAGQGRFKDVKIPTA